MYFKKIVWKGYIDVDTMMWKEHFLHNPNCGRTTPHTSKQEKKTTGATSFVPLQLPNIVQG